MADTPSVYHLVGGHAFFEALVDRFYDLVEDDSTLLPMYPTPDDLTLARRHLTQFLVQYWGGPTTYSDRRGHPRLRMRHMPFTIGPNERDAWLRHMTAAVESGPDLDATVRKTLLDYFATAAEHLVNAPDQDANTP